MIRLLPILLLFGAACERIPQSESGGESSATATPRSAPLHRLAQPQGSERQAGDPGPVFTGGQVIERIPEPASGVPAASEALTEQAITHLRSATSAGTPYDRDRDPCEQAWESFDHTQRAFAEARGEEEAAPSEGKRERFIATCNRLPEEYRPCLVQSFAAANAEECARRSVSIGGRANPRTPPEGIERFQPPSANATGTEGRTR